VGVTGGVYGGIENIGGVKCERRQRRLKYGYR
jgi:hypothetical protein